ncbi:unnamed protein product [Arabis nemorensis]|uniref:Uncharacterized protein n=1 Tax=Arabis nemorensis TaxID=586526 RepID=A0A565AY48_9BRAS|nr:unnamed protein product [Arabis nemorensis]
MEQNGSIMILKNQHVSERSLKEVSRDHGTDGQRCHSFIKKHGILLLRYEWDPKIVHLVKTNFDKLAASRLKRMGNLAKSRGVKPEWILLDQLESDISSLEDTKNHTEKQRSMCFSAV